MIETSTQIVPTKKYISFIYLIKRYQIITVTLSLFFLNQEFIFWFNYSNNTNLFLEASSYNILFGIFGLPIIYFIQWLLVIYVASKFPKEKLKEKFLKHPIATIILFILYTLSFPHTTSRLNVSIGNIIIVFEGIVSYAFISFLCCLLIFWISNKIWKQNKLQWNWYKKMIDKIFIIILPLYKFILGLIVALLLFPILFFLIAKGLHYTGTDIIKLFNL